MSPSKQPTGAVLLAPSPAGVTYDAMYYLKGAAAGGICCSITHGALCPVDVVKTRVQLDPVKVRCCVVCYNAGSLHFRSAIFLLENKPYLLTFFV